MLDSWLAARLSNGLSRRAVNEAMGASVNETSTASLFSSVCDDNEGKLSNALGIRIRKIGQFIWLSFR